MKIEILSPSVSFAHRKASEQLSTSYLADLRISALDSNFTSLEWRAHTFRNELADTVFAAASTRGVKRIKVRHSEIIAGAKYLIREALKADSALATKLATIRRNQERKEMMAGQVVRENSDAEILFAT